MLTARPRPLVPVALLRRLPGLPRYSYHILLLLFSTTTTVLGSYYTVPTDGLRVGESRCICMAQSYAHIFQSEIQRPLRGELRRSENSLVYKYMYEAVVQSSQECSLSIAGPEQE